MKKGKNTGTVLLFDTFGGMASTSLILCVVSGIFLAIPYDVVHPYESVSTLMIANPAASFIRNLHYWAAQLFLVFVLIHIFDHFLLKTERKLKRYQWIFLALSLVVIFYVMISGFILKGDPDGMQAFRILSTLISEIPLIGKSATYTFMGSENNLGLLYLHHVATATILIVVVTYNHVRRIFPGTFSFSILLFILLILSFFFQAPLHEGYGPVMKGPWYFLGLQEILHWMSQPVWIWLVAFLLIVALILVRELGPGRNSALKWSIFGITLLYIALIFIGAFFRGEDWKWKPLGRHNFEDAIVFSPILENKLSNELIAGEVPVINGHAEGCLVCHADMKGFSASHDPRAIGCTACHHGNPFTLSKKEAHQGMNLIPGNLADAARSCGTTDCHPDIPHRLDRSLMTTASGIVGVDRYVFGASKSLSTTENISNIGHDAADQHLRDLCANCHLDMPKEEPGPITSLSRGGGCNACHLNYSDSARIELRSYLENKADDDMLWHPSLDIKISDEHCFGCHSRSGRISLSYQGMHETLKSDEVDGDEYKMLEDKRVVLLLQDDIHHEKGMQCIDCHIAKEVMGDGNIYQHKEEQLKISCEDCHFSGEANWTAFSDLDGESQKIARLRYPEDYEKDYLVTRKGGNYILNIRKQDTSALFLERKSDGVALPLRRPKAICTEGLAHQALSCESCHTEWVPQCIGCHNEFDPEAPGMDLLTLKEKQGTWVEFVAKFLHDKPVLGVREDTLDNSKEVYTFTPGMILTIALDTYPGENADELEVFHRLYAPIAAHTTSAKGRDCNSCHRDPLAIGYGRGELVYSLDGKEGKWEFINRFATNPNDGLPEDAWTGFLKERKDQAATRLFMRPFNLEEQKAILTVGACLNCHAQDSRVMQESLVDFDKVLEKRTEKCILPKW